jgi:hypothetical protein
MRNDDGAELRPRGLAFHFKVCCRVGHEVMARPKRFELPTPKSIG